MNTVSDPMALSGVPRTLLLTTRARVEEHQRPDGILRDPDIAQWWPTLSWDPALDPLYSPWVQLTWAVRAHRLDQMVQRHLATYANVVVVELGAGLSTRYYRVGQGCRCWLELDLPEVIALRRQVDTETRQHRFLAASALDFSWLDAVPAGPPETLLILAEGLLMYFEPAQVQQLITRLKQRFLGATFLFDAVGGITRGRWARQMARLEAPLRWFIRDERDIPALGLSVLEVRSLPQDMCRYPHRLGWFRWMPWVSKLPPLRNACLILETKLKS